GPARAQVKAVLDQLSPARVAPRGAACAAPVLGRRGRARAERDLHLADLRLARARAVRPDGDRLRRSSESRTAPHARGLGGSPAAQGLPDRRRARPLHGRRMSATTERPKTYEGSRIPSRVPTVLDVPEELRDNEDVLQVNFGPNHPSTH